MKLNIYTIPYYVFSYLLLLRSVMMSASVPTQTLTALWCARPTAIDSNSNLHSNVYIVLCMRSIIYLLLLLLLLLHIRLYSIGADTKKYYKSIERIMYVISRCKLSNSETSTVLLERFVFGLKLLNSI